LIPIIKELKQVPAEKRCAERIVKFGKMGFWNELPEETVAI
jgi:acetyl-CoA carboxylase carboxyl transferase subunit alpha